MGIWLSALKVMFESFSNSRFPLRSETPISSVLMQKWPLQTLTKYQGPIA